MLSAERTARGAERLHPEQQRRTTCRRADRVVVQTGRHRHGARVFQPRSKTMPIVIFLAVMFATVGLAFLLENLRPRARPGEPVVATPTTSTGDDVPRSAMSCFTRPRSPPRSVPAAVVCLLARASSPSPSSPAARSSRRRAGGRGDARGAGSAGFIGWPRLLAALILIILFIPIRRYSLPGNLPFELEPYRLFVVLARARVVRSLLVDPRIAFRRTGFEGPLLLIVAAAFASIVANPDRVADLVRASRRPDVLPQLRARALHDRERDPAARRHRLPRRRRSSAAAPSSRSSRSSRPVPGSTSSTTSLASSRFCSGTMGRARGHPSSAPRGCACSALRSTRSRSAPRSSMLVPLALYLARRYAQRRWWRLRSPCSSPRCSTVSRTGIMMFVVVGLVFLWLRPRETNGCGRL